MDMTSLTKMLLTGAGGGGRTKSLNDQDRLKILMTLIRGGQIQESDLPKELLNMVQMGADQVPAPAAPPSMAGTSFRQ